MKQILKKLFFFSFFLALIAVTIAFFYFERSSFSEADLKVEIIGPSEVAAGEEVEYKVRYRNNSDIRLEDISVIFEYPTVSVPIEEDEEGLNTETETFRRVKELDNLDPGQEEVIKFQAKIFGEKGNTVKAVAWLNYTPQNLSATYEVKRTHTGIITDVPINFEFDLPNQMEAEEEFPFRVRYFSNSEYELANLGIKLEYPSGFEFIRSTPSSIDEKEWEREFLKSNEGGVIEIFGKLQGDPGDIKGFSAKLGVWRYNRFIVLQEISEEILIPQPNLFVDILVNDSVDYVAKADEDLLYEIYFKNIGDKVLENLFLTVDLDKEMMNMEGVEPMGGRFQEEAGSIIWSHSSFDALKRLRPDAEQKISFWTKVKEDLPYNPEINVLVNLEQSREEIKTKVQSNIKLTQQFAGRDDPLKSAGPLPLKINRPSTFTVHWEIKNEHNDLENVIVQAKLPEDASFSGEDLVDGELHHDSRTGEVTWQVGTVEKGTGFVREPFEAYFQVEIIPMSLDLERELISMAELTGVDKWVGKKIQAEAASLHAAELFDVFEIEEDDPRRDIEFEDNQDNEENN